MAEAGNASLFFAPAILDDLPATRDALDFEPYVATLADIVTSPQTKTPLTVGIFGSWGSGKTTILQMIEAAIRRRHPAYTLLRFDAWKFDKQDTLWRALLLRVLAALHEMIEDGPDDRKKEDLESLADLEASLYRVVEREDVGNIRVDLNKLGTGLAEGAVQVALSLVPGGSALSDLLKALRDKKAENAVEKLATAVSRERIKVHIDQVQFLEQFQDRFRELVQRHVTGRGEGARRMVVFVDDLDRCLPEKAVEVLEATKLFLDVAGCIFVLGLDHQVITRGIKAKYKDRDVVDGNLYLDKIIQLPFQIPPVEAKAVEEFVGSLSEQWPDAQCPPVFAKGLGGNPRRVKRSVNVFFLLWRLAKAREDKLKGRVLPVRLAKVVVLQQEVEDLYQILKGTPTYLLKLEEYFAALPEGEDEAGLSQAKLPPPLVPFVTNPAVTQIFRMHPAGPSEMNFEGLGSDDLNVYFTLTRRTETPPTPTAPAAGSGFQPDPVPVPTGGIPQVASPARFLHNLPYPPLGDLFTGRQGELDALASSGTAAITQSVAISGLGGIGKTRLAVEYAWRSGPRYTASWFVRADSPENLHRNLTALAGPELLNLPERKALNEEETFAAVKRWLREHPGWLMILDNVDTPEAAEAVLEVLPSLSTGRVLITSRLTTWPATVRPRSLDTLCLEEAARFLLHRTEEGRTKADDDDRQALALAEALDGLPLALEQAAAFILRRRLRLADYLRAWEQERSEVLKWHAPRAMDYPAPVAVTWKQTFDRLSPTSAALLRLMAFMAPDPIPVDMFEGGTDGVEQAVQRLCEETGKAPDEFSARAGFNELADYSLVTRQDGGLVTVHRMVQEVLRNQIPVVKDWIEWTLQIVNGAAVGDTTDVRTWPVWDRLRPHVAEIVTRADEVGIVEPTSRLLSDLGVLLWAKGLYSKAEPLMRRALAIDEDAFGSDHPRVARDLNNLAPLLQATNRLGEAEPLMRRALAIDEAAFGNDHPNVAKDLDNLATLLQVTNRLEEAEPLIRRALAIDQTSFGNDHPTVAKNLDSLARLLQATNRLEEAEPLMRRALAIDEAAFGNDHPNVARDLDNLALLLQDTNRLGEAEPLMRRALAIDEAAFGNNHPNVARDLNNLARLLQDMNRLEEAEPLIRRALAIDEAAFDNDHPNVARDLNNLALLLQDTNRLEEAESLIRRALDIDNAAFGNDHPNVARDLNDLALLLQATNRLEEAESLMRCAVDIFERSLGLDHPWTQIGGMNLENLLARKAAASPGGDGDLTDPEAYEEAGGGSLG